MDDDAKMLAEIRALCDAATRGPWRRGQEGNLRVYGPDSQGPESGIIATVFKGPANVEFIAAAREALPTLLRMLDELEADFNERLGRVMEPYFAREARLRQCLALVKGWAAQYNEEEIVKIIEKALAAEVKPNDA